MLNALQRGLEILYRIDTRLDVRDFVIDEETRAALFDKRTPREQLLVSQTGDDVELALFIDDRALANLEARDPRARLDDHNLQDFLLIVEGVSHFVYIAWRAQQQRPVSGLELELQAEVDKYVVCLLTPEAGAPPDLRARLFDRFSYESDLDGDERERYRVANDNARAYASSLHSRFVSRGGVAGMLEELRWFYRLGAGEKLAHIAKAA